MKIVVLRNAALLKKKEITKHLSDSLYYKQKYDGFKITDIK